MYIWSYILSIFLLYGITYSRSSYRGQRVCIQTTNSKPSYVDGIPKDGPRIGMEESISRVINE